MFKFREEIDVLVVAEERVNVVRMSQNIASPTVEHCDLHKGRKILRLVLQKQVTRSFMKQSLVAIALPQFVVEMPILATWPDTPFGDLEQCWLPEGQRPRDPVSDMKNTVRFLRIADSLHLISGARSGFGRSRFRSHS